MTIELDISVSISGGLPRETRIAMSAEEREIAAERFPVYG